MEVSMHDIFQLWSQHRQSPHKCQIGQEELQKALPGSFESLNASFNGNNAECKWAPSFWPGLKGRSNVERDKGEQRKLARFAQRIGSDRPPTAGHW
jgi:hypothetical protein